MWGIHDSLLLLRRLLYIALVQDTGQIKTRWRKEKGFQDSNIPGEGCRLDTVVMILCQIYFAYFLKYLRCVLLCTSIIILQVHI